MNYEEFRLPEQGLRTRNIFSPAPQQGIFRTTATGGVRGNLLALAAANDQTSTIDPTVGKLLVGHPGEHIAGLAGGASDPNIQRFTFINKAGQIRKFGTRALRLQRERKNSVEVSWNYQDLGYTGAGGRTS